MSRGEKGPVPLAEGDLVLVTVLVGVPASELGDFRVVPDVIPDGLHARPGDTVEVDQATADRWVAAGIAQPRVEPPPP